MPVPPIDAVGIGFEPVFFEFGALRTQGEIDRIKAEAPTEASALAAAQIAEDQRAESLFEVDAEQQAEELRLVRNQIEERGQLVDLVA